MNLPKGTFLVGNKLMGICEDCGKLVHINKPVFGSIHVCVDDSEFHVERHGSIETGWVTYQEEK